MIQFRTGKQASVIFIEVDFGVRLLGFKSQIRPLPAITNWQTHVNMGWRRGSSSKGGKRCPKVRNERDTRRWKRKMSRLLVAEEWRARTKGPLSNSQDRAGLRS